MEKGSDSNELMETDDFTSLIRRIFLHKTLLLSQKKTPALDLKKVQHPFLEEIRTMMYIFGDVENPLVESVCLISKILKYQMNNIIKKASEACPENNFLITHENLLHISRHNKERMWQLLNYLSVKDVKEKYKHNSDISEILKGKRTTICSTYLNELNGTKEFDGTYDASKDPLYIKRINKRYARIQNMSDVNYVEFSKKLQASFLRRYKDKERFAKWLLEDFPELELTQLAIEILNFFARETVAEIVESSVAVQESSFHSLGYKSHPAKDFCSSVACDSKSYSEQTVSSESESDFTEVDGSKNSSMLPNVSDCELEETKNDQSDSEFAMVYQQNESERKRRKVCVSPQYPIYPRTIREVIHRAAFPSFFLDGQDGGKSKIFLFCF